MERKSTQRIIGILVVIALVIILLPLLFGKNEMLTQAATIKAPPFPDQQTAENNSDTVQVPNQESTNQDAVQISPAMASQMNGENTTEIPIDVNNPSASFNQEAQAVNTNAPAPVSEETSASANKPVVIENDKNTVVLGASSTTDTTTEPPAKINVATEENTIDAAASANKVIEVKPVIKHTKKSAKATASSSHSIAPAKLKTTAWAVQMGSFKVKQNAVRLADRLRAAGYKAFTRDGKSSTRVYVGPEAKQASAANLSSKIQQEMNIHGIIVSFKPLEL